MATLNPAYRNALVNMLDERDRCWAGYQYAYKTARTHSRAREVLGDALRTLELLEPRMCNGLRHVAPHEIKTLVDIGEQYAQALDAAHRAYPLVCRSQAAPVTDGAFTGDVPTSAPPPPMPALPAPPDSMTIERAPQWNAVKRLGEGKIGGYLVRFSGPSDPDGHNDFFTPDTDFGDHAETPIMLEHGMGKLGRKVIGRGRLRKDAAGIYIDGQLDMTDPAARDAEQQIADGKLGWSSGTANHLVEREKVGKARRIKRWPLGLDASLVEVPAEPRNVATIKAQPAAPPQPPAQKAAQPAAPRPSVPFAKPKSRVINTQFRPSDFRGKK